MTVKETLWRFREEDRVLSGALVRRLGTNDLLARVLVARGYVEPEEAYDFLNPNLRSLHGPDLMKDMDRGAARIAEAIHGRERILVHGDYDADGITSAALMSRTLAGCDVHSFIPDRLTEGYGISGRAISDASASGTTLMVSVDCGIRATDAVSLARESGIDVVITDHHEQGEVLPNAVAVIDPKRADCPYPFKDLAGVGVAFKLASRLSQLGIVEVDPRSLLELVAIGTISDVVPLTGENRVLVHHGLKALENTDIMGLRALLKECGLDPFMGVRGGDVAYKVSPRLNAAGRIGDPRMALDLFMTSDRVDADLFARQLNSLNFRRKAIAAKVFDEAVSMIEEEGWSYDPCIVVSSDQWHPGVLGAVSSRLSEATGKPVIVIALEGDRARGSGRSPKGTDLLLALHSASDLLEEHGGHQNAAGITLKPTAIDELRKRLSDHFGRLLPDEATLPAIDIDLEVGLLDLGIEAVDSLQALEPTGADNPENVICLRNLELTDVATVGDGEHLRVKARSPEGAIGLIWFGMGHLAAGLSPGAAVDVVGSVSVHRWGGREDIQVRLMDLELR